MKHDLRWGKEAKSQEGCEDEVERGIGAGKRGNEGARHVLFCSEDRARCKLVLKTLFKNIWCMDAYIDLIFLSQHVVREGPKKNGFIWDFVPNIGPHPPTARVWDSTKWKIKVKFTLLFRLFWAFYFFGGNEQFFGQNSMYLLGTLDPHPPTATSILGQSPKNK